VGGRPTLCSKEDATSMIKQGKSSFQYKVILLDPKMYTETVEWMEKVTIDCCDKIDRCLCYLKKQLGNSNNVRIPCLDKKGVVASQCDILYTLIN
jgi:hypothetical protein